MRFGIDREGATVTIAIRDASEETTATLALPVRAAGALAATLTAALSGLEDDACESEFNCEGQLTVGFL